MERGSNGPFVVRSLPLADPPRPPTRQQEEERIDAQIKKLEEMDEDDFEVLRQKRLEKLKRQEQQKAEWRLLGHGMCVAVELWCLFL